MELHEYQAKMLLQRFHVPCLPHFLIGESTSFDRFQSTESGILRPQVRGKIIGDGEKEVLNKNEIELRAKAFIGNNVVTDESGPEGFLVTKVLFLPKVSWDKAVSLSVSISTLGEVLVRVKEGDRIFSEVVPERKKLFRYQLSRLVTGLHVASSIKAALASAIDGIVAAFFQFDAKNIEIDPFIITEDKSLLAHKVRMHVDENAFFRQREVRELIAARQQSERERLTKSPYPYIIEKGLIGCLGNGRGLGSYTASAVRKYGGSVAGILDIGDVCSREDLVAGLNVLIRDPAVHVVCINLLTGLIDGEAVVSAILKTLATVSGGVIRGRFFLRIEGTNANGGCLLAESSKLLKATRSFKEAVRLAVDASKG